MFGIENFALFVGAGIMLNLYPGPDSLYIIGRSIAQGRVAGVAAALGISTGALVHTTLGAFGLSAILATSAYAFLVLKVIGCVYLVWQGFKMITDQTTDQQEQSRIGSPVVSRKIFRQGVLTNVLNPKVAVFFLAFLPQFISPDSTNKPLSFMILGAVFICTGTIWCLLLAFFSAFFSQRFSQSSSSSRLLKKISGTLFVILGIKLVSTRFSQ
ncbi:MAG: LysE family translocator [Desulfobulbaceae bacterium]|nr:MAG: LysE family translocator [Desulfobulbaceae bacterium]